MKFTEAHGLRPRLLNRSRDAEMRVAKSASFPSSPFQNCPYRIPKTVIPLGPSRRKAADLITTRPTIPRLGDKLDLAEDRILPAGVKKAAAFIESMWFPGQYGRQVEAEAIDPHLVTQ